MLKKSFWVNKTVVLIVTVVFAFTWLSGCATKTDEDVSTDGITFVDDLGREVTVPENPQRVAALIGSFADVWLLAGGTLCAAAEDAWEDFGIEQGEAVSLGGAHSPNLESLLYSEPDFVIASASTAADVEMKEALEGAGIVVAYFDVDCFEDYLNMLDICTDITGRKDLYEKNGLDIKEQIEQIKSEFNNTNITEEQKNILMLRVSSTSIKAKGSSGTILGEMLNDLGCINIADSDKSLLETLSVESIIANEPYHIFVVTMGDDTEAAVENLSRMMEENPAWGTLEAVKENRLYVMDRRLFNLKPNVRWAEAYEELSKTLQTK